MKILVENRRARYDYEIIDKFTAGISLFGWEVKSILEKNISLVGAFCYFKQSELFLANAKVGAYKGSRGDTERSKKLLLRKHELRKILKEKNTKKLAIVPLSICQKRRLIKVEIALARGKTKIDKRNAIKEREAKREVAKSLKNYY
ncbi:SsrA-binding protein SmpB [Mycoplasma sp. 'Moose RK']|uniref:SsrA-binding protein SmpB n=1 Tax=Mycoplasma sp. 'Moose RK' TaxID=2780095 RepID=UPI0018C30299|nr:SsrA-binding protein SmpB [Mycoplasma sp. 'Moose RK']MBG0731093.1 SsrA-binding protein SmpB [Mycoplasma sp. 'Moose RK']